MNCKKVQKYIPDLRSGNLTDRINDAVNDHLAECRICQRWLEVWDRFCDLGTEVIQPPEDFNWTPFDQTLEAELQRQPALTGWHFNLKKPWKSVVNKLYFFPNRLHLRVLLTGAAAVFIIFISSQLTPHQQTQDSGDLVIGGLLTSNQESGMILYREAEPERIYFRETIRLETAEGRNNHH